MLRFALNKKKNGSVATADKVIKAGSVWCSSSNANRLELNQENTILSKMKECKRTLGVMPRCKTLKGQDNNAVPTKSS